MIVEMIPPVTTFDIKIVLSPSQAEVLCKCLYATNLSDYHYMYELLDLLLAMGIRHK